MPEQLRIVGTEPDDGWTPGKDSDECYTPAWILALAAQAMGGPIDTDPAWSPRSLVRPLVHGWTHADDGATRPWAGRVWCNPPYSDPGPFCERAVEHALGRHGPVVMLLKLDPSTRWWEIAMHGSPAVVMLRNRVRFLGARPHGEMPALLSSAEVAVFPSLSS